MHDHCRDRGPRLVPHTAPLIIAKWIDRAAANVSEDDQRWKETAWAQRQARLAQTTAAPDFSAVKRLSGELSYYIYEGFLNLHV
jgi:hypothetical protein